MIRTEAQRKAMYARMQNPARPHAFPLKGQGGRARRNRGTAVAAGLGAGSLLVLGAAMSRGRGLSTLVRANRAINPKTGSWAFTYKSAPEGGERVLSRVPYFGPLLFGGKAKMVVNRIGVPEYRSTITNVPPLARAAVDFRRRIKGGLANVLERASVWKLGGTSESTLKAIGDAGELAKAGVAKTLRRMRNRLVTPRVVTIRRYEGPTNKPGEALVFKVPRRLPQRIDSPIERLVDRPFRAVRQRVKYVDVMGTRRMRQWIRRQRRTLADAS